MRAQGTHVGGAEVVEDQSLDFAGVTGSFAVLHDRTLVAHMNAFDEWAGDAVHRGDVDTLVD